MRAVLLVGLVALVAVAAGVEQFTITPSTVNNLKPGTKDESATFVLTVKTGSESSLKAITCANYNKTEWEISGIKVDGSATPAAADDFTVACNTTSNVVTVTIVNGKTSAGTLNNYGHHNISGLTLTAKTTATPAVTVSGKMDVWYTGTYDEFLTLTVNTKDLVKSDHSFEIKAEITEDGSLQSWDCTKFEASTFKAYVAMVDSTPKTDDTFTFECNAATLFLTATFDNSSPMAKQLFTTRESHKVYGINVWATDSNKKIIGGTVQKPTIVTTYDDKLAFSNDLPNGLSAKDGKFVLKLDLTNKPTSMGDYEFNLIADSWTKNVSGTIDKSNSNVTFMPSLTPGFHQLKHVTVSLTNKTTTSNEKYIPFVQNEWNTRVYDKNAILSPAFDGTPGTVDLTKDFTFKVCLIASAISKECTGVQFTEHPVFWNDAKSSKVQYQPQDSTFDKLNAEFTIDPTSEFMDEVAKLKEIGIGDDNKATPGSTWTPSFTSGSLIHAPYIVVTQGTKNTNGTLHVELKEGYYHPEQDYTIDVIAGDDTMTINIPAGSANGTTNITLTAADVKTAGKMNYTKTLKLLSSEDSEGLINMVSANPVDLFVVDDKATNLKVDVTAPFYVTNVKSELNNTVMVKLNIADKDVYPLVANYRVQLYLNGTAHGPWVASPDSSSEFDIDVSDLITSNVTGFYNVSVNYKATVKTMDWNLVDIVTPNLKNASVTDFTAVYAHTNETNKDRVLPPTVSDDNCNVDVNYTFVERTPALTNGSCYLKTDMNKTIKYYGEFDKNKKTFSIIHSLEFRDLVKNHLETFHCELDIANDEAYWQLTQDMSSHKFTHYDANPLSSYKNETYVYNLVKSQKKLNCVGSYYGMVMANCTNGKSVNVTGNGAKWYYNANGTKVVYDKNVHNISSIIMETCGSAAIFPAALVIAAVSLFNIFK